MRLYSSVEFDPASVEGLIQRYTEFRLRECLLDKEFAAKVRHGGNGHLYVKTLRE